MSGLPATATDDSNNIAITFTAKESGASGNDYTLAFVISSDTGTGVKEITRNVNAFTITLNADGASFAEIKAAADADTVFSGLFTVTIASGQENSGIFNSISSAPFLNGVGPDVSFAENVADDAVLYRVEASDADGDAVTYSLDAASQALFEINSNGEISLKDGVNLDFETAETHNIEVTATSTFTGGTPKTTTIPVKISVDNVNEAPETPTVSALKAITENDVATALANTASLVVAQINAVDPDVTVARPNADSVTYAVTGGTHASLFEMQGEDLVFTGTEADFLNPGQLYEVIVTATDEGGLTSEVTVSVTQGGVYLETGPKTDPTRHYTDAEGIIPEALDVGAHDSRANLPHTVTINGTDHSVGVFVGRIGDHSGS